MHPILYVAIAATVFCVIALLMAPMLLRPSPEAQRMLEVVQSQRPDKRMIRSKEQLQEGVLGMARDLRGRLGLGDNPKLRMRLFNAGLREPSALDVFFAYQFMLPLVGAFAGSFIPDNTLFWVFTLAAIGYISPDIWLTSKTKKRNNRIRRSMPDAIDLLVICVEAGLGLDQALMRVGEELALSHAEINEEFTQVHLEQRAGKPRLEAWQDLAARTKIEEFVGFTGMLVQSERFGTPIVRALSRFSDDLRTQRRQHAEEAAAKTKIKIIFPLVLFIFPCIFIVLLAPAMLSIASGFKALGN
jgi:tight adherence protein C